MARRCKCSIPIIRETKRGLECERCDKRIKCQTDGCHHTATAYSDSEFMCDECLDALYESP